MLGEIKKSKEIDLSWVKDRLSSNQTLPSQNIIFYHALYLFYSSPSCAFSGTFAILPGKFFAKPGGKNLPTPAKLTHWIHALCPFVMFMEKLVIMECVKPQIIAPVK